MPTVFHKMRFLFIRGFKQAVRPYPAMIPEFFMPLFFFAVNSAAFQEVASIQGFTHDTYLQFYAPVGLLIAIFISSGSTGLEVVTDISNGFMDRLFLTPVNRWLIVFAKLAAVGAKSAGLVLVMMGLLALFGAPFSGNIAGIALVFLYAFVFAIGWAGIGLSIAFITKNPRVVQSSFIFFFPFSFITTSQLPQHLLHGWYKTAVTSNPVTYILEGLRQITIEGYIGGDALLGILIAAAFAITTLSIATWAFRRSVL